MFMPHCKHYIGGIETARRMIRKAPTEGFKFVRGHGRLDLTVESIILQKRFHHLFDREDLEIARRGLARFSR